ncbi:MAG TPA: hypothetical protein VHD91_00965 [Gaiellaceae bacterium]|nr:hypothetical protein [Gaiellaceae bacterium]
MASRRPGPSYRTGLGASTHENAGAFAFSIMITSSFGVVQALEPHPRVWELFVFAAGAVAGFACVAALGSAFDDPEAEPERTGVVLVASLLSFFSVLGGVGAAALAAWLLGSPEAWPVGGFAAVTAFLLLNGLEYAVAELEEDDD